MHSIITNLPLVKASDVQKNFRQIAKDVEAEGYRYVVNRGNIQMIMVSIPFFQKNMRQKPKSKKAKEKDLFAEWKGKNWKQILRELREEDNKKPLDVYLKELLRWQKQFIS